MLLLTVLAALLAPDQSWLVGGWAPLETACDLDGGISFKPDGTYRGPEGEGVWSLVGNRLTVSSIGAEDFGSSDVVRVTVRGAVEMEMQWLDGGRAKFHRCPQGT